MNFKEQRRGTRGLQGPNWFSFLSLCLSNHLARIHDEATTSDYGSDIGNQFNIVAGADEHDKKAGSEEGSGKEGACRDCSRTPDPRTTRADAEPAGPDRCSETRERRKRRETRRSPTVRTRCRS